MIVFVDLLRLLAENGWSTYRLAKENIVANSTIGRLRAGAPVNTRTIDTICRLCHCQPGDLMRWVPDDQSDSHN